MSMPRYQAQNKPVRGRHLSQGNEEDEVQEISGPSSVVNSQPSNQHSMRPPSRGPPTKATGNARNSPQGGNRRGISSSSPSLPSSSSSRGNSRVSPVELPFARQSPDHIRERGLSPDELLHSSRKSPVYTGQRKPGRTPSPGSHGVVAKPPSPLPLGRSSGGFRTGTGRAGSSGPLRPSYDHDAYDLSARNRNKRDLDFSVGGEDDYSMGSYGGSIYGQHRNGRPSYQMPSRPPASYYNPPPYDTKDKRVTPLSFSQSEVHGLQPDGSETELDGMTEVGNGTSPIRRRHKRTASQEIEHALSPRHSTQASAHQALDHDNRAFHHRSDGSLDHNALLQNEQVRQHYAEVMARRQGSSDPAPAPQDSLRTMHLRSSIEQMADLERLLDGRYREIADRSRVGQTRSAEYQPDPTLAGLYKTSSSGTVIPHDYRGSHTSPLPPHAQGLSIEEAYSEKNKSRDLAYLEHSSAFSKHDMSEVRSSLDDIAHEIKQLQTQAQGVIKSTSQAELWSRAPQQSYRDKRQRAAEPAMAMMLTSAAVDIPRSRKLSDHNNDTYPRSPYGSPEKNGTHQFSNTRPSGIPRLNLEKAKLEGESPISSPKLSLAALVSPHSSSAFTAPSSSRSQLSSLSATE